MFKYLCRPFLEFVVESGMAYWVYYMGWLGVWCCSNWPVKILTPSVTRTLQENVGRKLRRLFHYLVVSWNRGTPKSSILMGCSIINQSFGGTPTDGNPHLGSSSNPTRDSFAPDLFGTDGCHYMTRVLVFWRQVFSMSQLLQEFREEEIDETSDNWAAANWQHPATTSVAEWLRHPVHEPKTCCWLPIFENSVATQSGNNCYWRMFAIAITIEQ